MTKKMKKVALLLIFFIGYLYAGDTSSRVGVYSGWYWHPYTSYYPYYPFGHYYEPWYYPSSGIRNSFLYPYSYPHETGWYGYNGYPYNYPYTGLCFHNSALMIDLPPLDFFDVSKIDKTGLQSQPGAAPVTLPSEDSASIQDMRLSRFLSSGSETNTFEAP